MTSSRGDSFHRELRTFRDLCLYSALQLWPFNICLLGIALVREIAKWYSVSTVCDSQKMTTKVVLAAVVTLMAMLVVASGKCPPGMQFASCLPFVNSPTAGSPSKGSACCKMVMTLSTDCLCKAATNPNPMPGVTVDFHKALTLPKACGRSLPPHTICNGTPVPGRR